MAYSSIEARHRLGISARAYRALHQWAIANLPGFKGRHEEMTWRLLSGLKASDLTGLSDCGQKTIDEIAIAMRDAGFPLAGHGTAQDGAITLGRGSKVYVSGRTRPLVVTDVGSLGEDVLLRLRVDDRLGSEGPEDAFPAPADATAPQNARPPPAREETR